MSQPAAARDRIPLFRNDDDPALVPQAVRSYAGNFVGTFVGEVVATSIRLVASSASLSSFEASTSSLLILSSSSSRAGTNLYNGTSKVCYIAFSNACSLVSYTMKMSPSSYLELAAVPAYQGPVSVVWEPGSHVTGSLMVTELSS